MLPSMIKIRGYLHEYDYRLTLSYVDLLCLTDYCALYFSITQCNMLF